MKRIQNFAMLGMVMYLTACAPSQNHERTKQPSLAELYADKFLIGTALNTWQVEGRDSMTTQIVLQHFNAVVPENCMKSEVIHPEENRYHFKDADAIVDFAQKNGKVITGHCLIWHSQCAPWFFLDKEGKQIGPEVLKQRMKDHITTVVKHFGDKIKGWDVVNEAIEEDGSYRKSKFYEILGEEFIPLAFQYAHEANPDIELYYNDYGMNLKGRREGVVRLIKQLKERGIRIDAVGMQGHMGMDYPTVDEFEESLLAFANEGVKVMITEWDMSALPTVNATSNVSDTIAFQKSMNPYTETLPDSVSKAWNNRMKAFFQLFLKHADVITRVTTWGVTDATSWKNDFPIHGRTDYPLLFDRNYQPKPFVTELLKNN